MIGDDVPGVDHLHVPAGPVLQGQAGDAHVFAIAQVDEPSPGPARNGIVVFALLHLIAQGGDIIRQPRLFRFDDVQGQGLPAAAYGSLSADQHVPAVGARVVVQIAQVQQALIAFHFGAFKAAGDFGQIIVGVCRSLQNRSFHQMDGHIAVQPQAAGQKHALGKIDFFLRPAIVQGFLQGGGIQGHAVSHGKIGSLTYVNGAAGDSCAGVDFPNRLAA